MSRCGVISIVGRPNVGKSTLLNRLIGLHLCITSSKPQTTRHRVLGILTEEDNQALFIDTPGLHQTEKRTLNRVLNKNAGQALSGVDGIVWIVEGTKISNDDLWIRERLKGAGVPVILVLNKVDRVKKKEALLPVIEQLAEGMSFAAVVPVSAEKDSEFAALKGEIFKLLPEQAFLYDADEITDRTQRFLAAELIREQLMRLLGDELPYASAVEIERFKEEDGRFVIHGLIWVESATQKAIVIGKNGSKLKDVGSRARVAMNSLFDQRVHLELWVKVRDGWADDSRIIKSLGYDEDQIF